MAADNDNLAAGQTPAPLDDKPTPVQTNPIARDENGRLLKGSRLNPKGGTGGRAEQIRHLLYTLTDDEQVERVWRACLKKAEAGDYQMAKLVIERLCGKAVQPILTNAPTTSDDDSRSTLVTLLALNPELLHAVNEAQRRLYLQQQSPSASPVQATSPQQNKPADAPASPPNLPTPPTTTP